MQQQSANHNNTEALMQTTRAACPAPLMPPSSNLQDGMRAISGTFRFDTLLVNRQVFYATSLSFAFVNIKPLLPGHILVAPLRPVQRLSMLTDAEAADLGITVKRVGRMLERVYKASALTVPLQDGFDAGQSVPHVRFHIIPQMPGDLDHAGEPDAIYDKLDSAEGDVSTHPAHRQGVSGSGFDENAIPLRNDKEMLD
jgi:bis(5'-adenosyl)-triphosphatase